MKKRYLPIILLSLSVFSISCEGFLEEKSDKQLTIPTTITDFKSLLYNNDIFMSFSTSGEISSDDLYITDQDFDGLYYESDKRLYSWQPDYVSKSSESVGSNWRDCYKAIYVCNSVLQGIEDSKLTGNEANEVRGQALVLRAARYLDGAQIWTPAYDKRTAETDLGMVIRLDPDMNLPSIRASVQQTYDQIIKDLIEAIPLLPSNSISPNIPTKAAAYGILARTYLIMADYEKAKENASLCLKFKSELVNFNQLNQEEPYPIPGTNNFAAQEIVFLNATNLADFDAVAKITPSLYQLYQAGDLRKAIYFLTNPDGTHTFKGSHMSFQNLMVGITTGEMLLILSECNARLNNLTAASSAINKLLVNRYIPDFFTPYSFTNKENALKTIFEERRKELVFRNLRWSDIKRLNRDGAGIILERTIKGQSYILKPNDKRYAIAIPEDVITIAKIPQNPR